MTEGFIKVNIKNLHGNPQWLSGQYQRLAISCSNLGRDAISSGSLKNETRTMMNETIISNNAQLGCSKYEQLRCLKMNYSGDPKTGRVRFLNTFT